MMTPQHFSKSLNGIRIVHPTSSKGSSDMSLRISTVRVPKIMNTTDLPRKYLRQHKTRMARKKQLQPSRISSEKNENSSSHSHKISLRSSPKLTESN